ncbi:hypothetical protein DPMN_142994 [Dreissena polymorpha]|uniref:Uncharacterized protein n=1 Tax=Dreissena polymorpha TaxID=45954 RepID=A0A9D4GCR9_DREPO|nr:hypothetical protein DPMN_142994 [Dreissena polymorpha]
MDKWDAVTIICVVALTVVGVVGVAGSMTGRGTLQLSYNVQIELNIDYLSPIPDLKPAAKIVGLLTNKMTGLEIKKSVDIETVVSWFNGRDLDYTTGFMRYGVRYQNGRLIVPLTDTFNIYSFLILTEDIDPLEIKMRTPMGN